MFKRKVIKKLTLSEDSLKQILNVFMSDPSIRGKVQQVKLLEKTTPMVSFATSTSFCVTPIPTGNYGRINVGIQTSLEVEVTYEEEEEIVSASPPQGNHD